MCRPVLATIPSMCGASDCKRPRSRFIVAASLLSDFQQRLDPTLQVRPFAAQQSQDHTVGRRLVLMQTETSSAETVIVLEERFQFIKLTGFEAIQGLPVIGLSQKFGAGSRSSHDNMFLPEQQAAVKERTPQAFPDSSSASDRIEDRISSSRWAAAF